MAPTLLVLAGFYPPEQRAIRYADALASAQGSRLVLVHARRAALYDPYLLMGEALRRQELADDADTAALLTELGGQLHAPTTVEMMTDLLPERLAELTRRYAPALFVLGLPAAPEASAEQLSHTALELLRAVHFPVLLVPEATTATEPPAQVLIAADREDFALTPGSAPAAGWLQELGAEVTVAHVSPVEDDAGCARALRAVQSSGLLRPGTPAELRGCLHAHPAAGLLAAATDLQADLLVLLARPRSYLGELFHRSITAQVLHRSSIPVLLLPVAESAAVATPPQAAGQVPAAAE
jgi:nucleotide-binding universal stress UspA family protein